MKQTTYLLAVMLPGLAGPALAAKDGHAKPAEHPQRSITTESGTEIIIRSEAEKKRRDAENSNRQADTASSTGLERAGERRADPAAAEERPWYDPFGWLPPDRDKDEKDSGWWPFD